MLKKGRPLAPKETEVLRQEIIKENATEEKEL